jgi:hypothetical protein
MLEHDECLVRLDLGDGVVLARQSAEVRVGCEPHALTDAELLEAGVDVVEVVDVRAQGVFDPCVGVQAAASLTQLQQPRPDVLA